MTRIMAILNVTPDSFSDGAAYGSPEAVLAAARKLKAAGADILDIGAESTRPGAVKISAAEEMARLRPVLPLLVQARLGPFSIDTYKPEVAAMALEMGVEIVNDINGIDVNSAMAALVKQYGARWILMHNRPLVTPEKMVADFQQALSKAQELGVGRQQLIIDPGIGFDKEDEDNLLLTQNLPLFKELGVPLLYGPSRKRFLQHYCQRAVDDCDRATAAVCAIASFLGVELVRVHNVEAVLDAVKMGSLLAIH